MKFDWRNNRDFFGGLFYIVLGALGWWIARDYPFGSALRMGPGYFPTVLSWMMIAFGIAILLMGVKNNIKISGNWSIRALIVLPIGTAVFGWMMEGTGFLPAILMLLPITFNVPPVAALIMLAGIYYGAQYGGSTTAILVNLPGETSAVVTCLDGYQMARQGRAGPALAIAAIGSFFAGTVCTLIIALFGPPLAEIALKFGAPEYFSLMLMGLVAAAVLAGDNITQALAVVGMGLLLRIVCTHVNSGMARYSFGVPELTDGIGFIVIAVGVFAVAEIVLNLGDPEERIVFTNKVTGLMPTKKDLRDSFWPIVRGTGIGAFLGVLPGTGPAIASFSSYMVEKKMAKDPSRFGKGAIEGVAGPEAANN